MIFFILKFTCMYKLMKKTIKYHLFIYCIHKNYSYGEFLFMRQINNYCRIIDRELGKKCKIFYNLGSNVKINNSFLFSIHVYSIVRLSWRLTQVFKVTSCFLNIHFNFVVAEVDEHHRIMKRNSTLLFFISLWIGNLSLKIGTFLFYFTLSNTVINNLYDCIYRLIQLCSLYNLCYIYMCARQTLVLEVI